MTAKEYLSQARNIKIRIETMREQLEFLKSAAVCITPMVGEMSGSGTRNIRKNEDAVIRVMDYEEKINAEITKLADINDVINSVADSEQQAVIVKRYLFCKTWSEISNETYISVRKVYDVHQSALNAVETLLKI